MIALVAIAASAGGIQALHAVLSKLPANFPAAVAVVLHRGARVPELLPRILAQHCKLPVKLAEEGEVLRAGVVFVAPADLHMSLAADETLHFHDGRRINFVHSSANPLLDSAAAVLGGRLIAVVLTGSGSDAADGVHAVRATGGSVIAQDPATAEHAGMPTAAIATGMVDYVLPLDRIAGVLVKLTA